MNTQLWIKGDQCPAPSEERFNPGTRRDSHWKPDGGLWTSSLIDAELTRDGALCDWNRWSRDEHFNVEERRTAWALTPAHHARIYEVASMADANELSKRYGHIAHPDAPLSIRHYMYLDWEAVADDFDAVWLNRPDDAYWFSNHEAGDNFWLMGWDAESTVWLHWAFSNVEHFADIEAVPDPDTKLEGATP